MKRIINVIILLVLFLPFNCFASTNTYTRTKDNLMVPERITVKDDNIESIMKTPSVSSSEKIYDFADLFSDEEEKIIYQKLMDYIKKTELDSVIVTTKDLKGFSIKQYTYNFYDYNLFENEGVIFTIYISNNYPEIFMGTSGEKNSKVFSLYSDKRTNEILKYLYPDIKSGNYVTAADNYIKIIDGFYELNRQGDYRVNDQGTIVKSVPWFELIVLASAITMISIILFTYKLKVKMVEENYGLDNNIVESTMMVKLVKEDIVNNDNDEKLSL